MSSSAENGRGPGTGQGLDPSELARKISAQAVYERPKSKRFYKVVSVERQDDGFGLHLDGRPVKTPLKSALMMPTEGLAQAVAAEWESQEEHIDPSSMLLTKLCNTALDRVGEDRARIVDEIVDYANADLLCYRAQGPQELLTRQCELWDPVLDWAASELGARFLITEGVVHQNQDDVCLKAFRRFVDDLSDHAIAGYHNAMTMTGSAVLAAAAMKGRLNSEEAWSLAHVDEDWQIEHWGADEEEAARRAGRREEFLGVLVYLSLLE